MALAVPQGKADEVTVGDQSSDTYYAPIYGSWLDTDGTMSQTIYSKSLLSDLAGKQITKIKYYAKSSIETKADGVVLQVSMMETNVDEFTSATPLTGLTTCATYTFEGGNPYIEIELDNPFTYSGNNNLVVEVKVVGSQSSKFTTISWYGKTADGYDNVTYYHYSTNNSKTFTMPMTTFICGESAPKPKLTATPATLNFSTVAGTAVKNTVTVTGANLTGDITTAVSGTNASYFTVSPESLGTNGGELTITYNPTAAGNHTATLTLSSAGAEDVTIALTGNATAPAGEVKINGQLAFSVTGEASKLYDEDGAVLDDQFTESDLKALYTTGFTVPTGKNLDGHKVMFTYWVKATTKTITVSGDTFPGTFYVQGDTYSRSDVDGRDQFFQFIVPKAKLTAEQTITLEAEGDPSTFNMNLTVLRPESGEMMKLVQYDLEEPSAG